MSAVIDLDMDGSVANSGLLNKHLSSVASNTVASSTASLLPRPSVGSDASSSRASSSKLIDILGGASSEVMSFNFKVSSEVKKYMSPTQEQLFWGSCDAFLCV